MSEYDAWIKLCEEIGSDISKVEESELPQTGLYKTQKKFMHENREYGDSPVFHVWYKGQRMYCGMSYYEAITIYKDFIRSRA